MSSQWSRCAVRAQQTILFEVGGELQECPRHRGSTGVWYVDGGEVPERVEGFLGISMAGVGLKTELAYERLGGGLSIANASTDESEDGSSRRRREVRIEELCSWSSKRPQTGPWVGEGARVEFSAGAAGEMWAVAGVLSGRFGEILLGLAALPRELVMPPSGWLHREGLSL